MEEARNILSELHPRTSNDPETLGIWGAIHKRLWELDSKPEDLEESIRSYGKGFYLKDDHYNGINYVFMLNVRASVSTAKPDAIADFVWAERVRRRVIELCEAQLAAGVKDDEGKVDHEQLFWLRATLIEALVGTGQTDRAASLKDEAIKEAPEKWMAGDRCKTSLKSSPSCSPIPLINRQSNLCERNDTLAFHAPIGFLQITTLRLPHFALLDPLPNAVDQSRHL